MSRRYTEEENAFLRDFIPGHTEREIADAFEERFGRRLKDYQIGNRKTALGVTSGTTGGRFVKGQAAHNKGRSWDEQGISPESQARSRSTCFKKGNVPHNAKDKPVGYERVNRDGYTEVKVADRPSSPDCNDNFRMKHHLIWEEANGQPVPPSTMIVFADRDKRNFDPQNLVAVPRGLWATISKRGIPYYDRESLEAAMALARLDQAAFDRKLTERGCVTCGKTFKPRYPRQRNCDGCIKANRRRYWTGKATR